MKKYYVDIIQFRGDHRLFGYEQGRWLRQSPLYPIYTDSTYRKTLRFSVNHVEATNWIKQLFPSFIEELKGLAEGMQLTLSQTIFHFSGFQQEWRRSGCSIFTGDHFMVRNYDFHPKTYEGRVVLYQPQQGYASIGPSQRIVGRADGMNEKGLMVGYNFVNRRHGGDGFIPTIITRMILEQCQSNQEAISLLNYVPHRHSFNYVLADRYGNRQVVEATSRAVRVKEARYSTNHFDLLTDDNRYHLADSKRRLEIFKKQPISLSIEKAYQLLNDRNKGIYSEKYVQSAGTLHTTVYNNHSFEVGIGLGHNRKPVQVNFHNWLSGSDIRLKKVIGQIETTERMPYMEGVEYKST